MRTAALALVQVVTLTALAGPTAAADDTAPVPEYQSMVDAYLRDYPGVPLDRARVAVETQGRRIAMLEELGRTGAADFGASWYDPRTNLEHVLVTSDAMAATVRALAARHGVDVVVGRARYRLRDLTALAARINAALTPDMVLERSVFAVADSTMNRVKVITRTPERAAEALAVYANDPRVVVEQGGGTAAPTACTSRTSCGAPFRSGISVGRDWDAGGPQQAEVYCSAGFTARATDGSRWMITAGHCAGAWEDAGVSSSCASAAYGGCWGHGQQWWGPIRDNWPYGVPPYANIDVARARRDNTYWTAGGYMYNAAAPNSPVDVDAAIEFRFTIQVGDPVCQSMLHAVPGASCGTVTNVAHPDWYGMVAVSIDSCVGDSGGGWYMLSGTQRWAVGIQSAADNGSACHGAGEKSYFSAIPDINAYWDNTSAATIRFEYR